MKPLRIEFQAFGPYPGHEKVDFGGLSSKGLFLICGKTGIGKTMILDAMTFALYGKSSGNGRNDFEAMRCTNAEFNATTFVRFEFENNGKYYLFERRLERKRKNLSASYNAAVKDDEGVWIPLMENAKEKALNDKAVEIIGLEYGQFRQVIVLPQGQFEKLLTSTSDEKEKILISIFGEEKWQKIADRFYEKAEERKNGLKDVKDRISLSLSEEGCDSVSDLELLIKKKTEEERILDEEYKKGDLEGTIKEQQEMLLTVKRFEDLHKAENTLKKYTDRREERLGWEKDADNAKRGEKVRPALSDLRNAENALETRKKAEEECRRAEAASKDVYKDISDRLTAHITKEKEMEDLKHRRILYEGKRNDYESIDEAEARLEAGKKRTKASVSEEEKAQRRSREASEKAAIIREEYNTLKTEHEEILNSYLSGITGELASGLKEGEPCPVCGSVNHPKKAVYTETGATRAMVDSKKKEADSKYEELKEKTEELEKILKLEKEKHEAAERAKLEEAALHAELEGKRKNLIEGIKDLKELEKAIRDFDKKIEAYEQKKADLREEMKKAEEASTEARTRVLSSASETGKAREKYDEAAGALAESLENSGFKSVEEAEEVMLSADDLMDLTNMIADYDAGVRSSEENLKALKTELKGTEEPDEEKCREILKAAEESKSRYIREKALISKEIERLTVMHSDLKSKGEGMEEKIREAEEDLIFAKKLRGDSGTGLQRYVLGIMFSSVIAEANKMLEMVHGGRYRLFRSDDKVMGTNKRGLELKVYDKYSGEHEGRFVSTLSGGEKFLASLALSIGMSTIAQKKGIRIDALFIDEGFGSLDDESIGDAMDILNSIREANSLVGIISHVQILQDQIPTKLRIVETSRGSHIVESVG